MAGNFLPTAKLTANGRPVLNPGEVECSLLSAVDLLSENLSSFPHLKSGVLILTTHRLLFLPQETTTAANFDSHYVPLSAIQQIFSAKKSLKSMFNSPRICFQVGTTPDGKITENGAQSVVITLVLKGKTDPDSFMGKFWDAWRGRAWEASGSASSSISGENSLAVRMPVVGVSGILRKEQEMWESTDKSLQDAFQDLNALMVCKCV